MKRILSLALALILVLGLCSCGLETPKATVPTGAPESLPQRSMTFDLTVQRRRPFTQAVHDQLAQLPNADMPHVESILIDDIPVLMAYDDQNTNMPILIFLHGGGGTKDEYATTLSPMAYGHSAICVAIDAGACGESPRGAMTDAEAIVGLVEDINKVIAYCSTIPGADLGRIVLQGGSMGGAACMAYLAHGAFTPLFVSASVPCADFTLYPIDSPPYGTHGSNPREDAPLSAQQITALLAQYNPIDQAENMMETFLLVSTGLEDSPYNVESCQALEARFQELGKENCQFDYYQSGHQLPPEAWQVADEVMVQQLQQGTPITNPTPTVTVTEK